jgi:tryptophan synthase alpha chain
MVGYPDLETSRRLLDVVVAAGADGIELGIPFSDPLADGVTIQRASNVALEHGASVANALDMVADLRQRHQIPIVMMSYVNPLLAYGLDALVEDAVRVGLDGFIVPDLTIEESVDFQARCTAAGLHYVFLVAPTTTEARLKAAGERASGFVYCVALVGTTGARQQLSEELPRFLAHARDAIETPLVVGFGLSAPAHVANLFHRADGAIIASAIINAIENAPTEPIEDVVAAQVKLFLAATRGATAAAR